MAVWWLCAFTLQVQITVAARTPVPIPRTFGNGQIINARNSTFKPATIFEHNLSDSSSYGVMTHWWSAGEQVNDEVVLDYWIDGETSPSVSFQVSMAAGQGFPRMAGDFGGDGFSRGSDFAPWGIYSAGGKMGKHGQAGGYFGYQKIMFQKSIKVTARTVSYGMQCVYLIVRGHEVPLSSQGASGLALPSGFTVPANARMQLQRIDNITFQPLDFVPIADLPKGYAGVLHMVTLAAETSPAGNNYIEGCWHLFPDADKTWPGVVVGTGTEDFFDGTYYFCSLGGHDACLFAHENSGLLHFSREWPNGTSVMHLERPYPNGTIERFSAYRFLDTEVAGFSDGGALHWRVGDAEDKCTGCPTGKDAQGKPCANAFGDPLNPVTVRSYAWMYTWPLDDSQGPAPSSPPVPCLDPSVCGPPFPPQDALEVPYPDLPLKTFKDFLQPEQRIRMRLGSDARQDVHIIA